MANPSPSGNGETRGIQDWQDVPATNASRPARSAANGARWPAKDFKPDDRQATGDTNPEGRWPI